MRRGSSATGQPPPPQHTASLTRSSESKQQPRVRQADLRNAPRSVGQEVSRYMALDSSVTVAKLQERIASDVASKRDLAKGRTALVASAAPLARGESVKYPVDLPIDLARDRALQTLQEDLRADPAGDPLNRMLARTLDRRDQRQALARRLQPSVPTIGDTKQPWEYQLMMAQRYADDGEGISNDFFAVLDSKAIVSDALHQHHSTAEIRQAVTFKFNDWVETITNEQPDTSHVVSERLNQVQRDGLAAADSQRVVDETLSGFTQVLDQLHVVGHDLEQVSQRAAWAEQNRLARKTEAAIAKTRHMSTLTDVSFRVDLVDPTGDEDEDESDDGGGDAGAHGSIPSGGRIGDDEHNRQLSALERKLRQRYDAMMQVLKTATAERRFHRIAEQQLRQTAEDRAKEIIRLRSLFKSLVENRGFTAAWDLAREEGYDKPNSTAAIALEAAIEGNDDPEAVHDVLRSVVEEVMKEFKASCGSEFVFSGGGGGAAAPDDGNFGIVLEDEAAPDAALFREMNDMRKKQAELLSQIESMQSDGAHREDLYQRLNKKHTVLTQEHTETTQLLEATEEDRNNKGIRLVELEKTVRDLSAKVATFERLKLEEFAELEQRHAADRALLERRVQDLEKEVQTLQGKSGAANNGADDAEESVEAKCKKALSKVQELEVQQRTVRGLNSALESKMNDLKAEAHQLVAHVVAFVEPFASHMAQARAHLQGATSLRALEAMRAMLWTDTESMLSDVRYLLIKPCMRHSADAVFPSTLETLDAMTTVDLTEVEEDKGTRALEKELQKAMQVNRELKAKLQRYEGELSHLRNNKAQVVDTVRSAMSRLADQADQAVAEALDIGEVPLVSDDDSDATGDVATDMADDASRSRRSFRSDTEGTGAPGSAVSFRTIGDGPRRSFRRPSLTGVANRRHSPAAADPDHGGAGNPQEMPLTDDPMFELVSRRTSGTMESSVVRGKDASVSEPAALRRQRSVLFEGARRQMCLGAVVNAVESHRSIPRTSIVDDREPEPSSPSPASPPSYRGNSMRRDSSGRRPSVAGLGVDSPPSSLPSVLREERSGSFVGRIYQDEGTTEVLDVAFSDMRGRFDAALIERDAALRRAACLTNDLHNQLVSSADTSARVLSGVVTNARAACFALRELSCHFAANVLRPIEANRSRLWISKEAEGLILEATDVPRRCVAHIRRLVQLSSRHHVRMAHDTAVFERLKREVLNVGDVGIASLWRRRMLHAQERHAEAVASELSALAGLHTHRVTVLTRISSLVELPSRSPPPTVALASRRGSSSQLASPRSNTPPPSPPPPVLHSDDATAAEERAPSTDADADDAAWHGPPPVECVDASCTTADPLGPPSSRLVSKTLLDASLDRITRLVHAFCTNSKLGANGTTIDQLMSEAEPHSDFDGVGGVFECGLEGFDTEAQAVRNTVRDSVTSLGTMLAAFQQRIESESYLRFIAPPAAPADGASREDPANALAEMLSALDAEAGDTEAPPILEDAEPTAATVTEKYVALEVKHKTLEGTLRETKQSLRKLLHNVAADKFVHIETKWYNSSGDAVRTRQQQMPQPCPCPACGKIMVTSPQKQLVRGARILAHANTETEDGGFGGMGEEGHFSLLRDDDGGVEWPRTGQPLPASLVAAEVRRLQHEAAQHQQSRQSSARRGSTPDAGDVSFVPMGQHRPGVHAVSPLTWTLAPPTRDDGDDGGGGAIDAQTPPPMATPRSHSTEAVGSTIGFVPLLHYQSPHKKRFADQHTQTHQDLLAPLLLAMLDRLPQQPHNDRHSTLPIPIDAQLSVYGESTTSTFDPLRSTEAPPAQMSAVRERLRHFSNTMRSSIAHEFTALAAATRSCSKPTGRSGEATDACLPLPPVVVPEEQTQSRFCQAILDHRTAPPFYPNTTNDVTLHITSSSQAAGHPQQSSSLVAGDACDGGAAARTLSRALRSADVHRRLGSGGSRPSAPLPRKEDTATSAVSLGIVGSRPPSAAPVAAVTATGSGVSGQGTVSSGTPLAHLRHVRQGSARRPLAASIDPLPASSVDDASVEGGTTATIPTTHRKA